MRFQLLMVLLQSILGSESSNRQKKNNIPYVIINFLLCGIVDIVILEKPVAYPILNNKDFQDITTKQIIENSHLTLVCPEIDKESHIEWFKDNRILNCSFRNNMGFEVEEPHLTIDASNSLYILHATKREEGNYACTVDGQNEHKFFVKIVSKSMSLDEDFIRFSFYLGFVLSLTLACYCAGICFAWHRRASFADPLNLYNIKSMRVQNI